MYCVAQETEAGLAAPAAELPERSGSELAYSAVGIPAEPALGQELCLSGQNPRGVRTLKLAGQEVGGLLDPSCRLKSFESWATGNALLRKDGLLHVQDALKSRLPGPGI